MHVITDTLVSGAADNGPYSAREAAAILGVSERTVRRAIARGEMSAGKRAGVFRITPEALAHYRRWRRKTRPPSGALARSTLTRELTSTPRLLRLVDRTDGPAFALPRPLSPFLGREREIASVVSALGRSNLRLLTLIGPGGIGKTRLSLRVAEELAARFPDGVVFVPLAPVVDATVVPFTVAQALGVWEYQGRLTIEQVVVALRDRRLLLILDNFEHVLASAPFVADLLAACPALSVLVTSRTTLNLTGEQCFPVPPMTLLDPARAATTTATAASHVEAVQLFVTRAQAAQPGFMLTDDNASAVAEICHRLDGLPLSIELAAARISVLPPPVLLARLDRLLPLLTGGPRDAPDRLRTMRDAIAWSYDLLSDVEQALFRRLAVFVGGFTLDAAEWVEGRFAEGGEGGSLRSAAAPPSVLDALTALVACSLLRVEDSLSGEPRYVMLETIREFGLEHLEHAEEDIETRRRYAAYFLAFSEQGYPNHFGPFTDIDLRLQQIEDEQPNLRAALTFMADAGDADGVLHLAGALALFWLRRGHLREGRRWLEWALAHTAEAQTDARCRALVGLGSLRWAQGEHEQAAPLARAAVAIAEAIDDQEIVAHAIHLLGLIAEAQELWGEAESLFVHALARWRTLDAWVEEAVALQHLSNIVFSRGDRDLASQYADASLTRFRASGYASGAGMALCRRAQLARERGDGHEAALAYHEALRLWSSQNDHWYIRMALAGLAELASAYGQSSAAASLLGSVDTLAQEAGALLSLAGFDYDHATTAARAALGSERFAELHAKGQQLSLGEAVAIATTISVPTSAADRVLTAREIEVLRLIAAGRTDREIADALFVSSRTVNAHVAHIFTKLDVHTRRDAVIRGHALDLLTGNAKPKPHT